MSLRSLVWSAVAALAQALAAESALAAEAAPCAELAAVVDLKSSPSDDRREFCAYAKDTVAGGCCQSSLYDCLKGKPACARGQVLAEVGKSVIQTGATEEKAVAAAAAYEQGFALEKRNAIDPSKVPCRGPENGVLLAEFSDFDCPHCAAAQPIVEKLLGEDKQVRFCAFTFPLPGHPFSQLASVAALYADSQGKYWPMAKALFASQSERESLDQEGYKAQLAKVGKEVGLDPMKLLAALKPDGPLMEKVKDQMMLGITMLIQGTPTFYLDGRELKDLPLGDLGLAVRDERDSKGKR